jgi:hypothetical protein
LGFRVWGLGLRVHNLRFELRSYEYRAHVVVLVLRGLDSGFRAMGKELRARNLGFRA